MKNEKYQFSNHTYGNTANTKGQLNKPTTNVVLIIMTEHNTDFVALSNSKVAVIGAGISGLAFAYYLSILRKDVKIVIFEKSHRSGGYIDSPQADKDGTIMLEKGPRTLRGVSDGSLMIVDLFKQNNMLDQVRGVTRLSFANRKYLLDPSGQLVTVPPGEGFNTVFNFLFKSSLTKGLIFNIMKEPFRPLRRGTDDESVESFFNRRFGVGLSDGIVSAIFNGIYAGDVGKLSVKSVMPSMYTIERKNRSSLLLHGIKTMFKSLFLFLYNKIFSSKKTRFQNSLQYKKIAFAENSLLEKYQVYFSSSNIKFLKKVISNFPIICFKHGMESVTKLLTAQLEKSPNVEFMYNTDIKQIKKINNANVLITYFGNNGIQEDSFAFVNSTIAPSYLSPLLSINPELQQDLMKPTYSQVYLINVYVPGKDLLVDNPGFGFLIPKMYDKKHPENNILGIIFDSDVEKHSTLVFNYNSDDVEPTNSEIQQFASQFDSDIKRQKLLMKDGNYHDEIYESDKEIAEFKLKRFDKKYLFQKKMRDLRAARQQKLLEGEKSSIAIEKAQSISLVESKQNNYTKVTVMMGGHHWNSELDIPTQQVAILTAKRVLKQHLNIDIDSDGSIIEAKLVKGGIPQYNVGYEEWKEGILQKTKELFGGELALSGMNFNGGIGVPDCVSHGFELAFDISGL